MIEDDPASKVRAALAGAGGSLTEIKMFGGIGFMLDGNMVVAVSRRGLMLHVGRERYAEALARPEAHPVEMRGRQMEGYVRVDPAMLTDRALKAWLAHASAFVRTLPAKAVGAKPTRKRQQK
jgi:TfoX/Sxy family transcriptional regulator of competence genes